MDRMNSKEAGTHQTCAQSCLQSMAANPSEGDYNGAVECDVNDVIPERIEPTDQVIPSLKIEIS